MRLNYIKINLFIFTIFNIYSAIFMFIDYIILNNYFLYGIPYGKIFRILCIILLLINSYGYIRRRKWVIYATYFQIAISIFFYFPSAYFFAQLIKYYYPFALVAMVYEIYKLIFFLTKRVRKEFR